MVLIKSPFKLQQNCHAHQFSTENKRFPIKNWHMPGLFHNVDLPISRRIKVIEKPAPVGAPSGAGCITGPQCGCVLLAIFIWNIMIHLQFLHVRKASLMAIEPPLWKP